MDIPDFLELDTIHSLKRIGHKLLDEYVSLDDRRVGKRAVQHAYEKLGTKLDKDGISPHFSKMESKEQIIRAIRSLRKMIEKRKDKLEWRGKEQFAPNLAEIQKNIKQ